MFPTQRINTIEEETEDTSIKNTVDFDFDAGDFVLNNEKAQELSGLDSVRLWVKKILLTDQHKYDIYDEYGISLKDLMSGAFPQSYVFSEIERLLTETLSKHQSITSVYNFQFIREQRTLTVNFNIDTVYGNISEVIRL